ncbi:uncharacterized protein LOC127103304 [Lathyrus oleraceus]|uniref:uncharacterized protein LOC127103304 n=1 Tax=Pisum sativum TaxID=3888 RepID=UPI0021D2D066|nr:uncharacterized protein LOC127103304 [Pisum sativum]
MVTCYNCGESGHINTHCMKPKQASTGGKLFAQTGTQTSSDDMLIRGICYINNTPLITGATHSFIVVDCVKRLGPIVSYMGGEMVIETPIKDSVTTTSSVRFLTPGEEEEVGFLSTRELKELLEEEAQVMRDFPYVFPEDIPDIPPERERERMSASKLAELKK